MSAAAQVERAENYPQKCSRTSDWNPSDGAISFIVDHRRGGDSYVNERRATERNMSDTELTCYQSHSARLSAQDEGTKELCTKLQHTGSLAICQGE